MPPCRKSIWLLNRTNTLDTQSTATFSRYKLHNLTGHFISMKNPTNPSDPFANTRLKKPSLSRNNTSKSSQKTVVINTAQRRLLSRRPLDAFVMRSLVCIAFTGFYLSNPLEFIIYCPTERTSRKPTSSPSMGKEFVTDEHNEKRRDDDASENKLATDGRDARSLAPDVVP